MMRFFATLICLAVSAGPLAAQVGRTPERLREQVVSFFMQDYRTQAGLSEDQFTQFQAVTRRIWTARRDLDRQQRDAMMALEEQMRPGVAADTDRVTELLDELLRLQGARVEQARNEQAEYAAFLNPVQRAQLVLAFMRLDRQIQQIMRQRGMSRGNGS